jgi:hypothetical protein
MGGYGHLKEGSESVDLPEWPPTRQGMSGGAQDQNRGLFRGRNLGEIRFPGRYRSSGEIAVVKLCELRFRHLGWRLKAN